MTTNLRAARKVLIAAVSEVSEYVSLLQALGKTQDAERMRIEARRLTGRLNKIEGLLHENE